MNTTTIQYVEFDENDYLKNRLKFKFKETIFLDIYGSNIEEIRENFEKELTKLQNKIDEINSNKYKKFIYLNLDNSYCNHDDTHTTTGQHIFIEYIEYESEEYYTKRINQAYVLQQHQIKKAVKLLQKHNIKVI